MCVCLCVHMCSQICVLVSMCASVCLCVHVVHLYVPICACVHKYVCSCLCASVRVYVCMCVHKCCVYMSICMLATGQLRVSSSVAFSYFWGQSLSNLELANLAKLASQ